MPTFIYLYLVSLGVRSRIRIHPPDNVTLVPEIYLVQVKTTKSEGYETMTQHSSDVMSEVSLFYSWWLKIVGIAAIS